MKRTDKQDSKSPLRIVYKSEKIYKESADRFIVPEDFDLFLGRLKSFISRYEAMRRQKDEAELMRGRIKRSI